MMNNLLDFSGKVALITGAAAGMGRQRRRRSQRRARPSFWGTSKKKR